MILFNLKAKSKIFLKIKKNNKITHNKMEKLTIK